MITFTTPPPGLGCRVFTLAQEEGLTGAFTLCSLDRPGVRLVALDPEHWAPGYRPRLPRRDLAAIDVADPDRAVRLVIATVRQDGPQLHLRAPILINPETGAAVQSILDERAYAEATGAAAPAAG